MTINGELENGGGGDPTNKPVLLILLFHSKWNWKNLGTVSIGKETNITTFSAVLFVKHFTVWQRVMNTQSKISNPS